MIPGFVNIYKDKDEFVHLYFYPGIDDNEQYIYKKIDLSNLSVEYAETLNSDHSINYKFFDKSIFQINCKLLHSNNEYIIESLHI